MRFHFDKITEEIAKEMAADAILPFEGETKATASNCTFHEEHGGFYYVVMNTKTCQNISIQIFQNGTTISSSQINPSALVAVGLKHGVYTLED